MNIKQHTSSSLNRCKYPQCLNLTFDGKEGYCSKTHRDLHTLSSLNRCKYPHCLNLTFDGKEGYCSKTHRDLHKLKKPIFEQVIAFYYQSPVDNIYGYSAFGNFTESIINYKAPHWLYIYTFKNVEAAFQAAKFDEQYTDNFSKMNGSEAIKYKKELIKKYPHAKHRDSNFKCMKNLLKYKFTDNENFQNLLLKTYNKFLIEHYPGKPKEIEYWSDNNNGSGYNWLGFQLMYLRAELSNNIEQMTILKSYINPHTGDREKNYDKWIELVQYWNYQI